MTIEVFALGFGAGIIIGVLAGSTAAMKYTYNKTKPSERFWKWYRHF